jgi:integrase
LLELPRQTLTAQVSRQLAHRADMGSAWQGNGLVFTTRTGCPVEPRNFVRSFRRICDERGIRVITVHHVTHTVASLLKDLRVPARDAQAILGHTRISTTLEIYTDTGDEAKRDAPTRPHDLLTTPSSHLLLQKTATNRAQAIRSDDVWAGGAKGIRTPDLLHAMNLRHVP